MQITIHYLAQLKRFAGVPSETVEVGEGCTLPALLAHLVQQHGDAFRDALMDDQGHARPALLFFLQEDQVRPETARALHAGDEVTILSPMAGG